MECVKRDPLAGRIPIILITGFLGSGKTTLLGKLLRHPGMDRAAVVINELGDVAIDHLLVATSSEQMTLLGNGCLCCTVRTDLQETLREMFIRRRAGEVIDFDRVFVETTGLADPVPVLHSFQSDGLLGAQYRLDGVVTVVDAVNGMGQLDTMPEAVKQAAVADRIVLSKTDIAGDVSELLSRLKTLNPFVSITKAIQGEIDPALLVNLSPGSEKALPAELSRWLGDGNTYLGKKLRGNHDAAIHTFSLRFEHPFTWDGLNAALQTLTALRGPDLLRVKGIVNVEGESGPVILQAAQHVIHPPVTLEAWRDADRSTRIVFITRNIARESVESLFVAVGALEKQKS
ncbi:MAG: GTP-binding protein [Betaproteobacteria bacterium]|nr:GTP-binding protein [Betaproteobacteria bacterium]